MTPVTQRTCIVARAPSSQLSPKYVPPVFLQIYGAKGPGCTLLVELWDFAATSKLGCSQNNTDNLHSKSSLEASCKYVPKRRGANGCLEKMSVPRKRRPFPVFP